MHALGAELAADEHDDPDEAGDEAGRPRRRDLLVGRQKCAMTNANKGTVALRMAASAESIRVSAQLMRMNGNAVLKKPMKR
jgi:hypothetical protein